MIVPAGSTACLFLVLSGLIFSARAEETVVGSVKTAQGSNVVRRGSDSIPIQEGMHLLLSDILQTAADGRLGIILQDGTRISLGPNTELKVDRFVYQPVDRANHDSAMRRLAVARDFSPAEFPNSWSSLPLRSYQASCGTRERNEISHLEWF